MNCSYCGGQIPDDSRSCPRCGAPQKRKPVSLLGAILVGLFMGAIGAVVGWYAGVLLHDSLGSVMYYYGREGSLLHFLGTVYPVHVDPITYLPLAGAAAGILGTLIGHLRKSPRIWLWGLLAGLLLNVFFEFTFYIM